MWVPLLLAGATIAGILIAKKYYDESEGVEGIVPGTPPPPGPPPGVINLSTSSISTFVQPGSQVSKELVWVRSFAVNADHPDRTYVQMPAFQSLEQAAKHYDTMQTFFDKNQSFWTCPNGAVWMEMWGFGPADIIPRRFDYDSYACESEEAKTFSMSRKQTPTPPSINDEGTTKPLYLVVMTVDGATNIHESFVLGSDGEAEVYYRLLKAFFDQPIIRKAYTFPVGTIVLMKYGTPPSQSRSAVYEHDGQIIAV